MALNSWQFFLLAVTAVLVIPMARGWLRAAVFLGLNLIFVWSYWGGAALPIGLAFCFAGYVSARLAQRYGMGVLVTSLVVLTVLFVYLRGYSLGGAEAPAAPTVIRMWSAV